MTKAQKNRIIRIIKKDANGQNLLFDRQNETFCVIGGLLEAAGVGKGVLAGRGCPSENEYRLLHKVYGLLGTTIDSLININDDYKLTSERRRALIKRVKEVGE